MESSNEKETGKFAETVNKLIGPGTPVGNCWASMKNRMGVGSPEQNATDVYERGMKIVPDCIGALENETPVKQYNIAVLRTLLKLERAEGRMQVTNKRVLLRAAGRSVGGRTTLQHEFAINEIAGIEAKKNFKFSFLYLIFAVLISSLAFAIINGPAGIAGIKSPIQTQTYRIDSILSPKHLEEALLNEEEAILLRMQAEETVEETTSVLTDAQEKERQAVEYLNQYGENKRIDIGGRWRTVWVNTTEYKDACTEERVDAEKEERLAIAELEAARENEEAAVKKRVSAEKTWAISMTVLGALLGLGALFAFFALYKKFGLKLFLLNFGVFGFALSYATTDFFLFKWFLYLTAIITLICVFLFCFRPNLLISIKSKGGAAAVDIRRDTLLTRQSERGTGFAEIIPTEETEGAIREIGAMISDIQKSGDSALAKWTK